MSIRALKTWATNKHLQRECKNVIPKLFAQKLHSTSTAFKDSAVRQLDLTDSTEKKNDLIKLLFDDASIWRAHQQFNGIDKTGLFENPHFMSVQGFDYATKQAIQRAQIIVERICNAPSNGTDEMRKVVKNLDRLSDTLCSVIDIAEFVRNAHPDPSIMEAANKAYGDLCSYMNMLNTDTRLHEVLSQVMSIESIVKDFTADEHSAAIVFLRDFEKSGIHLPDKQRSEFVELSDRIINLGRTFIQQNPRSVQHLKIPLSSLANLSQSIMRSVITKGEYAYVATDSLECQLIMKYSNNATLRQQIFTAMQSATNESVDVLQQLLTARAQLATLVGKSSYSELQLQDKMAKNPNNVDTFLRTLQTHQLPTCQSELSVLQQMLQKNANSSSAPTVNAWDRDFAMQLFSTEQRRKSTDMSAFLPNFSVGSVIQGLSRLFKNLYGVEFEPSELKPGESWHDQVRKLDVVCEKEGKIGTIYCDLFSRAGKTTNAAHYTIRTSRRLDDDDAENDVRFAFPNKDMSSYQLYPPLTHCGNTIRGQEGLFQLPVIALTCDFSGSKNQSMLSMSEIETLFHEMGHAMHSMLGRTDFHNVAGTRCATDFVELPSILMEHFVLHPQILPLFSNQPVSDASVRYYQSQRKQFSGIEVNSQILMALLDQRYHSTEVLKPDFSSSTSWYQLQDEVGLFPSVPGTMWPVQFGHLFGYGANYYSYLFDRTLAKKIWDSSFKENPLDREKGQAFRENLLKWGGARDPWKCIASVLGDKDGELIAHGDERAMRTVGDWGIDV